MVDRYGRNLSNYDLIQEFLEEVLQYQSSSNLDEIVISVKNAEVNFKNDIKGPSTLISTVNRSRDFKTEPARWNLRKQIVKELFENIRVPNDEDIRLGIGGAIPASGIKYDKQLYTIIGLPASGKSSIANMIADNFGAVILDSDFAKRKLPEFYTSPAGASLVHQESDFLIFTRESIDLVDGFKPLAEKCISASCNLVIPRIGHDAKNTFEISQTFKLLGYTTHLILVCLDRRKATIRALERFLQTKRYVPLSLIFDGYGNDPILTYYRLKSNFESQPNNYDTFAKISTDKDHYGEELTLMQCDDQSPAIIFKKQI